MRGGNGKLDTRYLALFSGVLIVAVIASLLLFPEWRQSPATIILLVVAAVVGVVGFASNFRSAFMPDKQDAQPAALGYDSPQHGLNQENVTANVRSSYIDGVLREALPERVRLELALDNPVGVLRRPMVLHEGKAISRPLAGSSDIATIFKDSGRALLILGAPGSGKTITLLELCRPLLERAEADPRQPIPVVLNLSTWAQERKSLAEWIAAEMHRQYGLSPKVTPVWLAHDHLTLLLDGLDEVAPAARAACVRAINAYEDRGAGLVICSRSADYAELSEKLDLSWAIEIRPLDPTQVAAYLSDDRLGLDAVREAIRRDDALRELSATPLMLNVMAVAYGGRPFAELLPLLDSEAERRAHLYDAYIERVFDRRPLSDAGYTTVQALRWLRFITAHLTKRNETQFFIEDMQVDWLPGKKGRWVGVLSSVLFATLFGVAVSILIGTLFGVATGVTMGITYGVIMGLGEGFVPIKPVDELEPYFRSSWIINEIIGGLPLGCLPGLLSGVFGGGLVGALGHNGLYGILLGITFGSVISLLISVPGAMVRVRESSKRRDQPNQGASRSTLNALRAAIFYGVVYAIFGGLLGRFWGNLLIGTQVGAFYGLAIGLLLHGGTAVVKHYLLRLLLFLNHLLPLRLIPFLESMRERVLVQRAGAHYRFIHRTFQEHIAALTDERIEMLAQTSEVFRNL